MRQLDTLSADVKALPDNRKEALQMLLEREIYTANEAAELLRVHPHTLLRAIRAGRLKAFKVGGAKSGWRIKAAELERFTQEQNQPQQP